MLRYGLVRFLSPKLSQQDFSRFKKLLELSNKSTFLPKNQSIETELRDCGVAEYVTEVCEGECGEWGTAAVEVERVD